MSALLLPYQPVDKVLTVHLDDGPCSVQNIAMRTGNTISGRVWDHEGKVVHNAKVGLLDLDHPDNGSPIRTAQTNQPDDRFELKDVPLGRYLLAFNPEGAEPGAPHAFETTYFPRGSERQGAREVLITSGGQYLTSMDLALGAPVPFRRVQVQVQFPDGGPMTTARVRTEVVSRNDGDVPWHNFNSTDKSGRAELQVPANRRIKLTVTDAYHRPLKRDYVSHHEPGNSPIEQRFTIEP